VVYLVESFADCCAETSFLELPCEAVAEVIGSDDLPVEEAAVLAAVRAWFDHDGAGRAGSLKALVPLVRWPLLPVDALLKLSKEPLLMHMQRLDDEARTLVVELLLECSAQFAASDAAAECRRLKRRKGTVQPVLPLSFTALSQQHYTVSEDGALLTSTAGPQCPQHRAALCGERVMNSGQSCAEFTVVEVGEGVIMIGVGRPTLDPSAIAACDTGDFWGMASGRSLTGEVFHNSGEDSDGEGVQEWQGMQGCSTGDVLRLLLDLDAGTLTVKKNGTLLGVAVTSGLTGDLCWAVSMYGTDISARIKEVDPAEF
jgi:hypothetical protein